MAAGDRRWDALRRHWQGGAELPTYRAGTWLFLRTLGLVHLVAFASLWMQVDGLIGPHGLLPAGRLLEAARAQLGGAAYWDFPTLCWLGGTGAFLPALGGTGVVLALLLLANLAPGPCLAGLWVCYLSLVSVGQDFLGFQWDALLLETTLLALFVVPWRLRPALEASAPPTAARWLLWWLLARLMFLSGVVKLTSGDATWRGLTALQFHFETQPLPTWIGWYAHQLPAAALRAACAAMFAVELAGPFLLFGPRWARHTAALAFAGLMALIALTGNYTYFNLLTAALCLPCLDDRWWARVAPPLRARLAVAIQRSEVRGQRSEVGGQASAGGGQEADSGATQTGVGDPGYIANKGVRGFVPRWVAIPVLVAVVLFTTVQALPSLAPRVAWPDAVFRARAAVAPLRSLNNYGLFMVMTTERWEIVIEGTDDGMEWRPYEFRWKPGDLGRAPGFVEPFQPRLDWQMWFAAFGPPQQSRWFYPLLEGLLRGTPEVTALLAHNPFPDRPPRAVRAVRYQYHFTDPATRAATGQWWRRGQPELYMPTASLRTS
jgi:hypothetical protein